MTRKTPEYFTWSAGRIPVPELAGRYLLAPASNRHVHRVPFHALHVYGYAALMTVGGETRRLEPGCITLTPAGTAARYTLERPGRHWCVHFRGARAPGSGRDVLRVPWFLPPGVLGDLVTERLAHLAALLHRPHPAAAGARAARVGGGAVILEVLAALAEQAGGRAAAGESARMAAAIEQALRIVEEEIASPLSAGELAARVKMNRRYLGDAFRRRHGVTLSQHILTRRIERARAMLAGSAMPVRRIAHALGFETPSYFHRQFRRLTGATPGAFRRSVWGGPSGT